MIRSTSFLFPRLLLLLVAAVLLFSTSAMASITTGAINPSYA